MTPFFLDILQLNTGDTVQLLLLIRAYTLSLFALGVMAYLKFHTSWSVDPAIYYALGMFSLIWIVIGTGVLGYNYPFPGAILSVGLSCIMFLFGLGIGRILFGRDLIIKNEVFGDNKP